MLKGSAEAGAAAVGLAVARAAALLVALARAVGDALV
jgi:hypothetical protein